MSQQNEEAFKQATEAGNRRDWAAILEELDPEVEWYPALLTSLEGGAPVYRGHDAVREWFRSVEEVLASGAETESPIAYIVEYKNAKATRVRSYLEPQEALQAAGLSE